MADNIILKNLLQENFRFHILKCLKVQLIEFVNFPHLVDTTRHQHSHFFPPLKPYLLLKPELTRRYDANKMGILRNHCHFC